MPVIIDGFSTRLSYGTCTLAVCTKTVTPPEIDGGGSIDLTHMGASRWRQKAPKFLQSLNSMMITGAYDPLVYGQTFAFPGRLNSIQLFSLTFPDGSGIVFWGFIEKLTFQEIKEGEQPLVNVTITPTLWDGTFHNSCPVEVVPIYSVVTGVPLGNYRLCS